MGRKISLWSALLGLLAALIAPGRVHADNPQGLSAQAIKVPSGPSSLTGLGESFSASPFTGTGQFSIPIKLPPAPLAPGVALSYVAGHGQGALGLSFDVSLLNIQRSTDKRFPTFGVEDRFSVSGGAFNDELVFVAQEGALRRYRLKNEGSFALFEWDTQLDYWRVRLANGETMRLGASPDSQQRAAGKVFRWWITTHEDKFGHAISYGYLTDVGYPYLDVISYRFEAGDAGQVQVSFTYEARPYTTLDYRYGQPVRHTQLLTGIVVRQGVEGHPEARVLATYTLEYTQQVLFSLLSAVSMRGEHGEPMPTLRLDYYGRAASPGVVSTMSRIPSPGVNALVQGSARLEDVTGDGLPDILMGEQGGSYRYYRNVDGSRWATSAISLGSNSGNRPLSDAGLVLADMNADGLKDLAYRDGQTWAYEPSLGSQDGRFMGYGDPVRLSKSNFSLDYELTDPYVRLIDFNRDGRTDALRAVNGKLLGHLNLPGDRLEPANDVGDLPVGVDWRDARTMLDDFNGDGVLDLVTSQFNWSRSSVRVWYGTGQGAFERVDQPMTSVPLGNAQDMQFIDINRDGQTDLVRYAGGRAEYYLNRGDGRFTSSQRQFTGLPSNARLRLLSDMNGNGTTDMVWVTSEWGVRYLDFVREPFSGLISTVDNGMGLVTSIDYRSSTEYAIEADRAGTPWHTPLPHPVPVISEIRTTDSMSLLGLEESTTRTSFQYVDGYYDGKEREFRGFALVRQTAHGDDFQETLVTETHSYVGRDLESGEDEEALKGKVYLEVQRDAAGKIFSSVETHWKLHWLCQSMLPGGRALLPVCDPADSRNPELKDERVAIALPHAALTGTWEKTEAPRFSAVETFYEPQDLPWGNASQTKSYGEVTLEGSYRLGAGFAIDDTAIGNDETIEEIDYLHNPDTWFLGLPYEHRVLDSAGTVLSRKQTFYDYNTLRVDDASSLSRGLVTQTQSWLDRASGYYDGAGNWITRAPGWVTSTTVFNDDGMPEVLTDALGRVMRRGYHPVARTLTTLETLPTGSMSAPVDDLTFRADYDPAFGVLTSSTDLNGHETTLAYDGLGRVVSVTDHNGKVAACYSYEFGKPISTTITETLRDDSFGIPCGSASATDGYSRGYTYSDGGGRMRLHKAEAEGDYGYVGTGWMRLNRLGKEAEVFAPFKSEHAGFEAAPSDKLRVRVRYDGLGRRVAEFQPTTPTIEQEFPHARGLVQTSLLEFAPFVSRSYKERELLAGSRDYAQVTTVDGQGRAVSVTRDNDRGDAIHNWSFAYDARGLIVRARSEAQDREYRHDSLGRLREVVPQEVGPISMDYDDVGNVTRRQAADGSVTGLQYDRGNRPLMRRESDANGAVRTYRWHYDYAHQDLRARLPGAPANLNLKGRLAWVEFPTGSSHYVYDALGMVTKEISDLWDPTAPGSTFESQVRDSYVRSRKYGVDGKLLEDIEGDLLQTQAIEGLITRLSYNRRGLVSGIDAGFATDAALRPLARIAYDDEGDVAHSDADNGVRTCLGRNARRQIERIVALPGDDDCESVTQAAGFGFQDLRYHWSYDRLLDAVDDLSIDGWITPSDPTQPAKRSRPLLGADYEYDLLGQLTAADHHEEALGKHTYAYDGRQNLRRHEVTWQGSTTSAITTYHYGERGQGPNQLSRLSGAKAETLSYNVLGQLERYHGYDLSFDQAGHVVAAIESEEQEGPSGAEAAAGEEAEDEEQDRYDFYYDQSGTKRIARHGSHVERVISQGFMIRDGEPTWVIGAGATKVEIRRAKGVRFDEALLAAAVAYVDGGGAATGHERFLPAEYLDLNEDGSADFDALDLHMAQASNGAFVGGPRELWTYYHSDALGTATHVSDSDGKLSSLQQYLPFGEQAVDRGLTPVVGYAGNPQGLEADLDLMHMGMREYAPELRRWISPDPLYLEQPDTCLGAPEGCNLYGYAANNPIGKNDRGGMFPEEVDQYVDGLMAMAGDIVIRFAKLDKLLKIPAGPDARPYNYKLGKEPFPYFLGKEAHAKIYQDMFKRHRQPGEKDKQDWFGNYFSTNTILAEHGHPPVFDIGMAGNPDITFVRDGVAYVYEIKPFTSISDARADLNFYVECLNKGDMTAVPGPSELVGARVIGGPKGYFLYWSPEPGIILYAYFKEDGKGRYKPHKGKQGQEQQQYDVLINALMAKAIYAQAMGIAAAGTAGAAAVLAGLRGAKGLKGIPLPKPGGGPIGVPAPAM